MISNLKTLSDAPVARTNMVNLMDEQGECLRALLDSASQQFRIDFGMRPLNRKRKENKSDFFQRIHREAKNEIRRKLSLKEKEVVKYDLHTVPGDRYVYFYVVPSGVMDNAAILRRNERIEDLCEDLEFEGINLSRIIQSLLSLHLKIALLDRMGTLFDVSGAMFNSKMFLNPLKSGKAIEAFEFDVFVSDFNEVAMSLKKRKFLVEKTGQRDTSLDYEDVWFDLDGVHLREKRALDARDTKLKFFEPAEKYKKSQCYTFNVVMDLLSEVLEDLGVDFDPVEFEASHQVDHFLIGLDNTLSSRVAVVDNVGLESIEMQAFMDVLWDYAPNSTLMDNSKFQIHASEGFSDLPAGTSFLVLNKFNPDTNGSIFQVGGEKSDWSFAKAFEKSRRDPGLRWDMYTGIKIDRLNRSINGDPIPFPIQGIDVNDGMIEGLRSLTKNSSDGALDASKAALDSLKDLTCRMRRLKAEIWFKERLVSDRCFSFEEASAGRYTAYFVRKMEGGSTLIGSVDLKIDDQQVEITDCRISDRSVDAHLKTEPALARFGELHNGGFYFHDHEADVVLTSYNNLRVPRIIGNSEFDTVKAGKIDVIKEGGVSRSADSNKNPLPYLINKARRKGDPLIKGATMKNHFCFIRKNDQGVYFLLSDAQPARASMSRANLIENVMVLGPDGGRLDAIDLSITSIYLNSFTLDILKSGDSSKTSVFEKLARTLVEN
jgi:hypothetical protein